MKTDFILEIDGLTTHGKGVFTLNDISFQIREGECWAIAGGSGSGKSTLLNTIRQYKFYPENIRFGGNAIPRLAFIGHQNQFKNLSGINNFYYQQRFNATEADDSGTVMQELLRQGGEKEEALKCLGLLRIEYLQDIPLIQLSNGEHKRFQIAKALFEKNEWLLLDNPFTGLDVKARSLLEQILKDILNKGVHILVVISGHVPEFVTNVVVLNQGTVVGVYSREDSRPESWINKEDDISINIPGFLSDNLPGNFDIVVRMQNVNVNYHGKEVLTGINWTVRGGDRWCVSGANGSGKSTLLSLINGDNPQAFANDIILFDRKRGSGETIWDIKKRIGYVSPELHQHFDKNSTCFNTIASGLFDTIGLFRKLTSTHKQLVDECIDAFHLKGSESLPLRSMSFGMQRWVLLARAVIKNPPLLILDEPCQGLDEKHRDRFLESIEMLCKQSERTMVYVTHVEEEIPDCITHFLKLEKGKIKEIKENGKEHRGDSRRRHRA